jgi:hypothetical protein
VPAPTNPGALVFAVNAADEPVLIASRSSVRATPLTVDGTAVTLVRLVLAAGSVDTAGLGDLDLAIHNHPHFGQLVAAIRTAGESGGSYVSSASAAGELNIIASDLAASVVRATNHGMQLDGLLFPQFVVVADGPATSYTLTNRVFMPFAASVTWLIDPSGPSQIARDLVVPYRESVFPPAPIEIPGRDGPARITLGQNAASRQQRAQNGALAFADMVLAALGFPLRNDPLGSALYSVLMEGIFAPAVVADLASSTGAADFAGKVKSRIFEIGVFELADMFIRALERHGKTSVAFASAAVIAKNLFFIIKVPFIVDNVVTTVRVFADWALFGDQSDSVVVCQEDGVLEGCSLPLAIGVWDGGLKFLSGPFNPNETIYGVYTFRGTSRVGTVTVTKDCSDTTPCEDFPPDGSTGLPLSASMTGNQLQFGFTHGGCVDYSASVTVSGADMAGGGTVTFRCGAPAAPTTFPIRASLHRR